MSVVQMVGSSGPAGDSISAAVELVERVPGRAGGRGCILIRIRGALTSITAPGVVITIMELSAADPVNVVVDLAGVEQVDLVGLRSVVRAVTWARWAGRWMVVTSPSAVVRALLADHNALGSTLGMSNPTSSCTDDGPGL